MDGNEHLIEALIARIHQSNGFPAMSNTINNFSKLQYTDEISVSQLANMILKDYALTSKVLRIVNSAHYAHLGPVTTVSRAAVLLGFDNIKTLALSLVFFDQLQKNKLNMEIRDMTLKALYSGIVSQKIAEETNFVSREEAFICSLFHTFGKTMMAFYLPEKYQEVVEHSRGKSISIDMAMRFLLHVSFEEIGMAIAKDWNFPSKIIETMRKMRGDDVTDRPNEISRLISISTFSNEISEIISSELSKEEKEARIAGLMKTFKTHFSSVSKSLDGILKTSMKEMSDYSSVFDFEVSGSSFSRNVSAWSSEETIGKGAGREGLATIDSILGAKEEETPENVFAKGIQDINSAILNNIPLNETILIGLETMFSGMKQSRVSKVLFFVKDVKFSNLNVRFGFGEKIDDAKSWFKVPLGNYNDIFNIAILKQNDLVVKDLESSDVRHLLPDWYRARMLAPSYVIILPIVVNKIPLGIFYLEGERDGFKNITAIHLNYLKMLRDQIILHIRSQT